MVFMCNMHDVTMPGKMRTLKGLASRKGWVVNSSRLPHVLHNKTAVLNGNLILYSIKCMLFSQWEVFYFFED